MVQSTGRLGRRTRALMRLRRRRRMRRTKAGFRWSVMLWCAAATVAVVALARFDFQGLLAVNEAAFDQYQRWKPRAYDPSAPVKVIDIDVESLARLGQWPWPRTYVAELTARLTELGAASIAYDVLFAEPDRTSPDRIAQSWRETRFASAAEFDAAGLMDHDSILADVIAQTPTVLGVAATPREGPAPVAKTGVSHAGSDPRPNLLGFEGADVNLPNLEEAASGVGVFSLGVQRSEVVRNVPLMVRVGDQIVPTLSLEAIRVALDAGGYLLKSSDASGEMTGGAEPELASMRVADIEVPVGERGTLYAYFSGSQDRRVIPAWKVMEGDGPPAILRDEIAGAVVLVGTSAPGLLDIVATPLQSNQAGVVVHAELAEQMLMARDRQNQPLETLRAYAGELRGVLGEVAEADRPLYEAELAAVEERIAFREAADREPIFVKRPDWAPGAEQLFVLFVGLSVGALLASGRPGRAGATALLGAAGVAAACWYAFDLRGYLLGPVYPALGLALPWTVGTLVNYLEADRDKRAVRQQFAHFLSPAVIEDIAADPERHLTPGGDLRDLSIMFCDVRGFSTMTEKMTPQTTIAFINDFLTPLTEEITAHEGCIDKYMGDAIMAFWNAPRLTERHQHKACATILRFRAALDGINRRFTEKGLPEIAIGVGVNTGPCAVGAMGSKSRLDYSCIGDAVNLASRLEGLTKQYGLWNAIGDATAQAVADEFALIELDQVAVKGRLRPERVWTVAGPAAALADDAYRRLRSEVEAGLAAYRGQHWDLAEEHYRRARGIRLDVLNPEELADTFLARIAGYRVAPPPPDWDGVHEATSK